MTRQLLVSIKEYLTCFFVVDDEGARIYLEKNENVDMATRNWDACNYRIIDCSHFRMNAYTTKCIITSYIWDVSEIQYRLYHPAIKWNNQQ